MRFECISCTACAYVIYVPQILDKKFQTEWKTIFLSFIEFQPLHYFPKKNVIKSAYMIQTLSAAIMLCRQYSKNDILISVFIRKSHEVRRHRSYCVAHIVHLSHFWHKFWVEQNFVKELFHLNIHQWTPWWSPLGASINIMSLCYIIVNRVHQVSNGSVEVLTRTIYLSQCSLGNYVMESMCGIRYTILPL